MGRYFNTINDYTDGYTDSDIAERLGRREILTFQPRATWDISEDAQITLGGNVYYGGRGTEYGGFKITGTNFLNKAPGSAFLWLTYFLRKEFLHLSRKLRGAIFESPSFFGLLSQSMLSNLKFYSYLTKHHISIISTIHVLFIKFVMQKCQ